jgi:hypothetical protein
MNCSYGRYSHWPYNLVDFKEVQFHFGMLLERSNCFAIIAWDSRPEQIDEFENTGETLG